MQLYIERQSLSPHVIDADESQEAAGELELDSIFIGFGGGVRMVIVRNSYTMF